MVAIEEAIKVILACRESPTGREERFQEDVEGEEEKVLVDAEVEGVRVMLQ